MSKNKTVQNRIGAGSEPVSENLQAENREVSGKFRVGAGKVPAHSETFTESYQKKNAEKVAKQWEPKIIFCIHGWRVHRDDLKFVEKTLGAILTDIITRLRDEYNLIIGTTSEKANQAANSYLRELKEKSVSESHDIEIEVRLV